jgi:hypothetical protein
MKHDQRLIEFYGKLGRMNGISPEILLHEARVEFRRAWRRDLLAEFLDGCSDGGRDTRKGGAATPDGRSRRLRLGMENAWLWLYYRVEDEGDGAPVRASGNEGRPCRTGQGVAQGNEVAARILAAKNGRDCLASIPVRERLAGRLPRILSGRGEPGRDARYILGPR